MSEKRSSSLDKKSFMMKRVLEDEAASNVDKYIRLQKDSDDAGIARYFKAVQENLGLTPNEMADFSRLLDEQVKKHNDYIYKHSPPRKE